MNTDIVHNMLSLMLTRDTDETTIRWGTLGAHCRFAKGDVEGNVQGQ